MEFPPAKPNLHSKHQYNMQYSTVYRENAVTSCLKCNGRKGSRLLSELKFIGMKLHSQPRAPTRHELATKAGKMLPRKVHSTWKPYLGMVADVADAKHDMGMYDDEEEYDSAYRNPHDQAGTASASSSTKHTKAGKKKKKAGKKKAPSMQQQEQEDMQTVPRR